MKMGLVDSIWGMFGCFILGALGLGWVLKRVNWCLYERNLGHKQHSLPPGDLGWPFVGNMWSFLYAFKFSNPDSFISTYVARFGNTGMYKSFMFGNPTIIVTTPETCKRVLNDDDAFKTGWPECTVELVGKRSFAGIHGDEHKRLRRLTSSLINGHEALSVYIRYIEDMSVSALSEWAKMGQIELLTETRKLTFKIIMRVFLSSESENVAEALEKEYTSLNYGVRSMTINFPGFAYYNALKARKKLVAIFQGVVDERRKQRKVNSGLMRRDMMDALLEVEDENGTRLDDDQIIDILIMYLNAGHESSGHTIMWATVFLQQHPQFFKKAKAEQEKIRNNMPPTQKGLTLKEYRQMEYLSKVIDETFRVITISVTVSREAKRDVTMNGYIIPKGWKVLIWFRTLHLNPEIYPNPNEFNPSRWDNFTPNAGSFLPFGAGSRLCPGNDLAKLEIAIFLHHFLLNYKMEQVNPECGKMYLPHPRPKDNCLAKINRC